MNSFKCKLPCVFGLLKVFLFFLVVGLVGCNEDQDRVDQVQTSQNDKLVIVTTCGMVTDIVREICGEHAHVNGMMGPTSDPHLFTPKREHTNQLLKADVVFYSGLLLEGRMTDTFTQISRRNIPVYAVTEQLDKSLLHAPPEFEGHWDPHVWMNVAYWRQCSEYVAHCMSEVDPAHQSDYEANSKRLSVKLEALDEYVRKSLMTVPEKQRVLVTAHDAFGYFGEAYGVTVKAIQGISTESAAGVADINELVEYLVENQVKAVFVESTVSANNIKALREGAAAKGWNVEIGGELFSDAMGLEGTYEGTYIGMIDHNVTMITRALGGEAPEDGMNGKLTVQKKIATE